MRKQFVCVRITRLNGINLNRFTFDMDVTWNAFFTDSSLNIYSRYGGRDGGEPDARMSRSSLLQTMQEVLALHRNGSRAFQPVRPGQRTPRLACLQPEPCPRTRCRARRPSGQRRTTSRCAQSM